MYVAHLRLAGNVLFISTGEIPNCIAAYDIYDIVPYLSKDPSVENILDACMYSTINIFHILFCNSIVQRK